MNYKQLLIKYIHHVLEAEGTDFITPGWKSSNFTEEEWDELVISGVIAQCKAAEATNV